MVSSVIATQVSPLRWLDCYRKQVRRAAPNINYCQARNMTARCAQDPSRLPRSLRKTCVLPSSRLAQSISISLDFVILCEEGSDRYMKSARQDCTMSFLCKFVTFFGRGVYDSSVVSVADGQAAKGSSRAYQGGMETKRPPARYA
jgi:hypothetical protein